IGVVCAGVPERVDEGLLVPGRHGSRSLLLAHDSADVEIETRATGDPYLEHSWGAEVSRILFAPRSGASSWEMRASARA
ncbi:MAG TPA: hypothetical protein VFF85_12905, partial [Microbacterium sp.]|nr:hypothetical protein [Microbacterium sp.]